MDAATLHRFTQSFERLTANCKTDVRFGLAISGGPDSLALLLLANQAFPGRIAAATINHGLRAEAVEEAKYVARLCKERGIPHAILAPSEPITGNIQSAARSARYALLEEWAGEMDCDVIVTAHHADDQLETVLMRLARGSGVDGLSGIRAINGQIIRPLLEFTKSDLVAVCADAGVTAVHDPSNDNADFDRVHFRQYLNANPHPFDPVAANRSAAALAQASVALDWMVNNLSDRITHTDNDVLLVPTDLPRELQRRLLLKALKMVDPDIQPRGDSIERVLDGLIAGETLTLGNTLCKGGAIWHLSPAPKRRNG